MDPDGDDILAEDQSEAFDEFEKTVYEYLITHVDRRGREHGFIPEMRDDAGNSFEECGDEP